MPKPFDGHIGIIQRNAVESWRRLHPDIQIILFGEEKGVAEIAAEFDLTYIPNVERNEFGTPFVSDLFAKARQYAKYDTLCYVNGDIILLNDFIVSLKRVQQWRPQFLMVGQRWNLDLKKLLEFDGNWQERLREFALANGELHGVTGIDFFAFPKTFATDLPPFLVGRPGWDNYFLYYARESDVPIIDVTNVNLAIHQNHGYSHVQNRTGFKWRGPEADYNLSLTDKYIYLFILDASNWRLTPTGISRNFSYAHLRQRANAWFSFTFPQLRRMINPSEYQH